MTRISVWLALGVLMMPLQGFAGWQRLPMDKKQVTKQLQPRKFALVIGINQTKQPYWTPLLYAHYDAVRVAKAMIQVTRFDQVTLHTRKAFTSRQAILNSLLALKKKVRHPLDTVFVYVSAHGTVARHKGTKARYIVTSDTTNDIAQTALPVKELLAHLSQLASRRVVLMLATCYTGTPMSKSRGVAGQKGNLAKGVKALQPRALQVLSASGFAQAAYESTKLKSDVYTHFFLDCLRKLKRTKASVSAIDAHSCATRPTAQYVKRYRNEIQVPRLDSQPGTNKDVFLFEKKRQARDVGYFWAGRKEPHVRYEFKRRSLAKGPQQVISVTPGEYVSLRPGVYTVTIRDAFGYVSKRYTITIRRHRLSHLRNHNLRSTKQKVELYEQSRALLRGMGYTLAAIPTIFGVGAVLYGVSQNDSFTATTGGIVGLGAGVIFFTFIGIADVLTSHHLKRLKLEAKLFPDQPMPGDVHTPSPVLRAPRGALPALTVRHTLLHTGANP